MNYADILTTLQSTYKREDWKTLAENILPGIKFYLNPPEKTLATQTKQELAEKITELGELLLPDDTYLILYEIELKPGRRIANNRVSLRGLVVTEIIPGLTDSALVIFYEAGQPDWRISFISKQFEMDEEGKMLKTETHPKRYTYVVGPRQTCRTAAERLAALAATSNPEIKNLLEAFSVAAVSKEFFNEYIKFYKAFNEYLGQAALPQIKEVFKSAEMEDQAKLQRNFVKKLLGRIVFLYFLQKKGWMGVPPGLEFSPDAGEPKFMSNYFNATQDRSKFHSQRLAPLFYQAMNTIRHNDLFELSGSRIPYLNGGLFENDLPGSENIDFPEEYFQKLFDFFDRFNFTIDENNPDDQDVGIDPEMLGHIFESLLDDKSKLGTFYTPKNVVQYMCRESLYQYLRAHLCPAHIASSHSLSDFIFNNTHDETIWKNSQLINDLLDKVKICDPAIGSGAFPMGMVQEIMEAKYLLFFLMKGNNFDSYTLKLNIIQNSIYGVDMEQGAVDIARLRFWLNLIVDADAPKPLPNLDYKIMQGDSLYEKFEDIPLSNPAVRGAANLTTYAPTGKKGMHDMFPSHYKVRQETITFDELDEESLRSLIDLYYRENKQERKKEIHAKIDHLIHKHIELTRSAFR